MKTAELTQSERAKMLALWSTPLQQRIAGANPIVAATRAAMERTNWRISVEVEAGIRHVALLAYNIKDGRPVGVGESRDLATFTGAQTVDLVAYLNALEAPEA